MFVQYLAALVYMFFLHLTGPGKELFTTTQKVKNYGKHFFIIIFLIVLLFHTDCCLPITETVIPNTIN